MERRAHIPNATLSLRELALAATRPMNVESAELVAAEVMNVPCAVLFASARGALAAAIASLHERPVVAVPAYTCVAVPNAVISAGGTPLYVDVDEQGLVAQGSWPEADIVVVQDTYGISAPVPADRVVVRDSSHRAWDLDVESAAVTITSFEHSKWLAVGQGGLAVTADPALADKMRARRDGAAGSAGGASRLAMTALTHRMGRWHWAGRARAAGRIRRAAKLLDADRLAGQSGAELAAHGVPSGMLGRPDRHMLRLIVSQLMRAEAVARHRRRIVSLYDERAAVVRDAAPLLRYPMTVRNPALAERTIAAATGWDIGGRWFASPLHPPAAKASSFGYAAGHAPVAERLARTVINLPTHPLVSDSHAAALVDAALAAGARPLIRESVPGEAAGAAIDAV